MANEVKVISQMDEVKNTIALMEPQFKSVLPAHIKPERFVRATQVAIQMQPALLDCARQSLYTACMKCAADGLIPDGREAAIVKMGADAAYMPMIGGILKLIRNSGELKTIDADVVHEKDEYDSWVDESGSHFKHRKARGDRGAAILTYAYAVMKDGGLYFEEVSEQEMAGIQKVARSQNVWNGAFRDEMKKKSAIHRMAKRMPKQTDLDQVLKHDEELYDLEKQDAPVAEAATTSTRLSNAIIGKPAVEDANIVQPVQPPVAQPETPAPVPAENPQGNVLQAVLFEKVTNKQGTTNGKPWTKFGGKIGEQWYGTFDKKFHIMMQKSVDNRQLMNVTFSEKQVGDKTFYDIVNIQESTDADVQPVDAEEIPI